MGFIMRYVTTAQYLEIDPIFWKRVEAMFNNGDEVTFPNLHTLVTPQSNHPINHPFYLMQDLIGDASKYIPSVLRRLAIVDDETPSFYVTIPTHWSTLTHLSITTYCLSLLFWVSLTSAAPCLQWAYISFSHLIEVNDYVNPIERTLPQLSTLFITSRWGDNFLHSSLFKDLHLPGLSDLTLSSSVKNWWDLRGITDIYTILRSTPTIRKLSLKDRRDSHLSLVEIDYFTGTIAVVGGVAPIWRYTPYLVHLHLELFVTHDWSEIGVAKEWDAFASSAFFSNNRWLDPDNSVCPIKTITVVDYGFQMSNFQKCAGNAPNIALHIIADSESYTDPADLWKEWRLGN